MKLDLHMHTLYSDDGTYPPEELAAMCAEAGLLVFAVSDHNSIRGIQEAAQAAERLGLTLVPAVEMDCECGPYCLHVLGYGIEQDPAFLEAEEQIYVQEREASGKRTELVEALGIHLDREFLSRLAFHGIITGEMLGETALADERNRDLELLLPYREGGARSDNPYVNFYWDFCSSGKPAYVPIHYMSLEECVGLIHRTGGVAVLAHPWANIGTDREAFERIAAAGIDGVEVYSSYHTPQVAATYEAWTEEKGLFATVGSDFHGKTKPSIHLGGTICGKEQQIWENLKRAMEKRRRRLF